MKMIYKYYSQLPKNFIDSPTIKLAVPCELNDPFESSTPEDYLNIALTEDYESAIMECNEILAETGIVSFSDRSDEILMWSHYSNEHKGLCIEFEYDVLSSLPHYNKDDLYCYCPVKINYPESRVNIECTSPCYNLIREILTTKSAQWKYENEYRCIVPLTWCDKAIITNKDNKELAEKIISLKVTVDITTNEIIPGDYGSSLFDELAGYKGIMHLKNINPKKIIKIYLGCRYDKKEKEELINKVSNPNSPLHHIEILQYKLDKNKFLLLPEKVYPN